MLMPFSLKENGLLFSRPTPRIRKLLKAADKSPASTIPTEPTRKTLLAPRGTPAGTHTPASHL